MSETVLVTGGTGFFGTHFLLQLLQQGFVVRTSVRDLSKVANVKKSLELLGINRKTLDENLHFFKADLIKDDGWKEAISGSDYVLHVASPVPLQLPKDENVIIEPAVEGTLRVIKLSEQYGVKKLIFTSSFAAIAYGQADRRVFTEKDWGIPENVPQVYHKSKILAEKAAWDYVKSSSSNMKFTVINPVGTFGPTLPEGPAPLTHEILNRLLSGSMVLGAPKFNFGVVDIRDVVKIHIQALKMPSTDNERYLLAAGDGETSALELAQLLAKNIHDGREAKLPTREIPTMFLRFVGLFLPQVRQFLPALHERKLYNTEKARKAFNWIPIDVDTSLLESIKK